MPSEIVVALLGFLGTALGSMFGAFTSSRLTNYRLEQVEKKIDQLNDHAQRLALLEQRGNQYEERISNIEKKI